MTHSHWAEDLIGLPATDCWAFVRQVWQDRFGLVVPVVPYAPQDPRAVRRALVQAADRGWLPVATPREGDAVMMAKGTRPCHVGVWIDTGDAAGVLHWVEGNAVVFTIPSQLASFGYHILGFWRHPDMAVPG